MKKGHFLLYTVHKFCLSNINCSVDHSMKNRSVKKSVQLIAKIFIFEQGYQTGKFKKRHQILAGYFAGYPVSCYGHTTGSIRPLSNRIM